MSTARSDVWALSHELSTIEQAIEGAATLLAQSDDTPGDEGAVRTQASAMLSLVHRRLHDLGRVLRGELDPALLAAPHNVFARGAERLNAGEDVVFPARLAVRAGRPTRRSGR